MKIINILEDFKIKDNVILALGNFDGIHKGHRELIKYVKDISREQDNKSSILLFNEHTKDVLNPNDLVAKLTNTEDKIEILSEIGIDYIFMVDFEDIKSVMPDQFITLLKNRLNCKGIVVGKDYRFGKNAQGDIETLKKLCENNGLILQVVDSVKENNIIVKSTIIRNYIKNSKLNEANKLLCRNYSIKGKVVHGEKRGRLLGFPTANIVNEFNYILPYEGVYYTKTSIEGDNRKYDSLSFVGKNLTFNEYSEKIETYIFDFNDDIYGKIIKIEFINFIRINYKFDSKEELIKQMWKDVESANKLI